MLFRRSFKQTYCPMCGHPGHITDKYIVDWSEDKKEFTVSLALYCFPCGYHWDPKAIASLPLDIAREGNCSCGGDLSLGDHTVTRNGKEIEFRGKYFCERCKTQTTTIVSKLASAIVGCFSRAGKISKKKVVEVGSNGLSTDSDAGGIFISHASADRPVVEKELVELFKSHGIRVWYDKDDVYVSDYFERRILEGLKSCRWFLLAMTPRSAESEWVKDELYWAIENRPNRILPVMLDECKPEAFHVRLNRMYCPRYYRNPDAIKSQLIEKLLASKK